MNRNRWIIASGVILVALIALFVFGTYLKTTPPTPPPVVRKAAAPFKKAVAKAVPTHQVGTPTSPPASVGAVAPSAVAPVPATPAPVYCSVCYIAPAPTPSPAAPATVAPVPLPPPAVQPPSGICSEADNYYCGTPHPAVVPQSMPATSAPIQNKGTQTASGGFTLQVNIGTNGGWWGGPRYGYYGSTYGWTPGHEELRYARTGSYYRVWVAHPHPGY